MVRAGKTKKPKTHRPAKTPFEIVKSANYLNLAVMVRTLYQVYGWRTVRLARFLESYLVLMQEVADKRSGVGEFVKDTKDLTGIDVVELLDEVYKC